MSIGILGICGSPISKGNTEIVLKRSLERVQSIPGVETSMVTLEGKEIADCRHCNWCLSKQTDKQPCVQSDAMDTIYPQVLEADALLLATPVYVARLSGYMAALLDRLRVFAHGNLYKDMLADKVGGALAVGWFRHGGMETALLSILFGFMTYKMIPVGTGLGCPWGAPVVASVGGTGRFNKERRHGALEDEFGLQAADILLERMVSVAEKLKQK